jgi:uncharacterized protein YkwD
MRFCFLFISVVLSLFAAQSFAQSLNPGTPIGTYKTIQVSSAADCKTFCEQDWPTCRGNVTETLTRSGVPDPTITCYLNDGLSDGSPFQIEAPPPIDLEKALGDINEYRAKFEREPVILNDKLTAASQAHSEDIAANNLSGHDGSDGSTHIDRLSRTGYNYALAAENVATGQESWERAFEGWQKSPGHNEILLMPDATHFGVALTHNPQSNYLNFWTMLMARPLG